MNEADEKRVKQIATREAGCAVIFVAVLLLLSMGLSAVVHSHLRSRIEALEQKR